MPNPFEGPPGQPEAPTCPKCKQRVRLRDNNKCPNCGTPL